MAVYSRRHQNLDLEGFSSVEAQIAAIADDIAYNNHDMDDGIRSGLITVDALRELPLIGDFIREIEVSHPGIRTSSLVHELVRRSITYMVADVIAESKKRLASIRSPGEVRTAGHAVVAFSDSFKAAEKPLREFLFRELYRHEEVNRTMDRVKLVVKKLFKHYAENPNALPDKWRAVHDPFCDQINDPESETDRQHARRVADYIAGMTDRYAFEQYRHIFNEDLEIK